MTVIKFIRGKWGTHVLPKLKTFQNQIMCTDFVTFLFLFTHFQNIYCSSSSKCFVHNVAVFMVVLYYLFPRSHIYLHCVALHGEQAYINSSQWSMLVDLESASIRMLIACSATMRQTSISVLLTE